MVADARVQISVRFRGSRIGQAPASLALQAAAHNPQAVEYIGRNLTYNSMELPAQYASLTSMGRIAILCLGLILTGCVRRAGRNIECQWPGEFPTSNPTGQHLSADAEFAEDLAIRYADTHFGPRAPQFESMAAYRQGIEHCAYTLYEAVADTHHVPIASVEDALGKNRTLIDLAEITSFLLLYVLASIIAIRRIHSMHPSGDTWAHSLVLILFCSFAFALAGLLSLDEWAETMESIRLGTGHMSYREFRLPWSHHHNVIFGTLLALFWIIALNRARTAAHSDTQPSELEKSG